VEFDQAGSQHQPQPRPFVVAGQARVNLDERPEQPLPIFCRNPDAGIPDGEPNDPLLPVGGDFQADGPLIGGKLDRIAEQVDERLFQAAFIGLDERKVRLLLEGDHQALAAGILLDNVQAGLAKRPDDHRRDLQFDPARFNMRQVQNIIDNRQQAVAVPFHDVQNAALVLVERAIHFFLKRLRKPQNTV